MTSKDSENDKKSHFASLSFDVNSIGHIFLTDMVFNLVMILAMKDYKEVYMEKNSHLISQVIGRVSLTFDLFLSISLLPFYLCQGTSECHYIVNYLSSLTYLSLPILSFPP